VRINQSTPLSPEAYQAAIAEKGWPTNLLAKRWGLSERGLNKLISNVNRGRHYDDAVKVLPALVNW